MVSCPHMTHLVGMYALLSVFHTSDVVSYLPNIFQFVTFDPLWGPMSSLVTPTLPGHHSESALIPFDIGQIGEFI